MRFSGWSSLAISVCSALAFVAPATAHVTIMPPFVPAAGTAILNLTAPNERNESMTGFSVTVSSDFVIVRAHPARGWGSSVQGSTATWTGGRVEPGAESTFKLELEAPAEPGTGQLEAVQRYSGGEVITWDVGLTVVPESGASSQNLGWALVTAVIGVTVIVAIGVALFRRTRSLQEK